MIKLWIDDIRPAPEGYFWCKSVNDAIIAIQEAEHLEQQVYRYRQTALEGKYTIELIDLDYDAGDYGPPDYIKILDWLEQTGRNYPIRIHSQNPVGVQNMRRIIQRNGWEEIR